MSAAWGAFFGYATMALGIARNIVLVPLYLHYISAAEYGAWLATGGTLVQLLVSDFGMGGVIVQRTAAASGARDRERLSVILGTAWVTSVVLAVVVSAVSAGISPFLTGLLHLDASLAGRVVDCFLLSIAANAIAIVATISGSLLRGLQKAAGAGLIQFLAEVTVILATVVLLYKGYGLYALALGMVARSVFAALGSVVQTYRVCVRKLGLTPRLQAAESLQLMADSTRLFVVSISMKLLTRSDVFFVGTVLGSQSAAVYGITTRGLDTVSMLIAQLTSALVPPMAHLYGGGNLTRFRELLVKLIPLLSALALIGLATAAAVNRDFVLLWVGPQMFAGAETTFAFGAAAYVSFVGFLGYDVLMAAGQFQVIARAFAIFSLIQIPLMVLMLRQFGVVGAPIAAMISAAGWGIVLWRHVPKVLPFEAAQYHRLAAAFGVAITITTVVVCIASRHVPATPTWPNLAATTAGIAATMLAGILALSRPIRQAAHDESIATLRALARRS